MAVEWERKDSELHDKYVPHNTPWYSMIVVIKKPVLIIDMVPPVDITIEEKQLRVTKYKDLQVDIERIWNKNIKVFPIVEDLQGNEKGGMNEIIVYQKSKTL